MSPQNDQDVSEPFLEAIAPYLLQIAFIVSATHILLQFPNTFEAWLVKLCIMIMVGLGLRYVFRALDRVITRGISACDSSQRIRMALLRFCAAAIGRPRSSTPRH